MTTSMRRFGAAFLLAALAGTAAAHTGHGTQGLGAGLAHPLAPDHLLAMLAVGVWSAVALRGAQRCAAPATFVAAMLLGAALGVTGVQLPFVERGVAASVVVFGLLLVFATGVPARTGLVLIAASAALHGLAHGAEMPAGAGFAAYGAGFVVTTVALHAGGLALGVQLQRIGRIARPVLGALLGGAGVVLLAQL
jgi:urease accessory protein